MEINSNGYIESNKQLHITNQLPNTRLFVRITTEDSILEYEELKSQTYRITSTHIKKIECKLQLNWYEYLFNLNVTSNMIEMFFLITLDKEKPVIYINEHTLLPIDSSMIFFRKIFDFVSSKIGW